VGENSEVIPRENRITGDGKERAVGGSSNMMRSGRNGGNLRKNVKYLAIERRKPRKKESRKCKVPKVGGLYP